MPGILAKFANNVIAWAMTRNLTVFPFPEYPGFNDRFIVAGEDEQAIRTLFDHSIINRLNRFEGLFLAGAGNTLEYCPMFDKHSAKDDQQLLSNRINTALDVMCLFV